MLGLISLFKLPMLPLNDLHMPQEPKQTIPMKCKLAAETMFENHDYACINNEYYQYQEDGKNKGLWQSETY